MGEHRTHPVNRGEARPVRARTQHEQLWPLLHQRRGHQLRVGVTGREPVAEKRQQLTDLSGEFRCRVGDHPPAQDVGGQRVGARRPAQRQVDASRIHGQQRPERLGNLERGMVGQHDPRGADPDPRGMRADVRRQQLRGTARQAGHVVMLGNPVAPVAGRLDGAGDPNGADHRRGGTLAILDPDEIQHRQRQRLLYGIHHSVNAAPPGRIPRARIPGPPPAAGRAGRTPRDHRRRWW